MFFSRDRAANSVLNIVPRDCNSLGAMEGSSKREPSFRALVCGIVCALDSCGHCGFGRQCAPPRRDSGQQGVTLNPKMRARIVSVHQRAPGFHNIGGSIQVECGLLRPAMTHVRGRESFVVRIVTKWLRNQTLRHTDEWGKGAACPSGGGGARASGPRDIACLLPPCRRALDGTREYLHREESPGPQLS